MRYSPRPARIGVVLLWHCPGKIEKEQRGHSNTREERGGAGGGAGRVALKAIFRRRASRHKRAVTSCRANTHKLHRAQRTQYRCSSSFLRKRVVGRVVDRGTAPAVVNYTEGDRVRPSTTQVEGAHAPRSNKPLDQKRTTNTQNGGDVMITSAPFWLR